jgi:catechol-2,3-dioxygenase
MEQNSWAKSISAITLFVEDLEETKKYYQNVFGLPMN